MKMEIGTIEAVTIVVVSKCVLFTSCGTLLLPKVTGAFYNHVKIICEPGSDNSAISTGKYDTHSVQGRLELALLVFLMMMLYFFSFNGILR